MENQTVMNTETNQDSSDENTDSEEKTEEKENTEETTDTEGTDSEKKVKGLEDTLASNKRDFKKLQKENEELKKPKEETSDSKESESNEPDYARLAFLNSHKVEHPDDQKVVLEEADRLKLPLTDVLQMEHIKAKLETQLNERTSQEGMPKGTGRKGGPNKGDVDYYIAHPEEHPDDLELHDKVITAKLKKEEGANKFADQPFIG